MAFESLSNRVTAAFKHIVGKDKLSEKNIDKMLEEIRIALLEADVNYRVVKRFIEETREKMIGVKVSEALNPDQMVFKIVKDEITALLGEGNNGIAYKGNGMTVVMVVGLQGTGKTTNIAKIAKLIKDKENRKPMLIAADLIRPAAIEQLQTLGKSIDVEVFAKTGEKHAVKVVEEGIKHAAKVGCDTVLIDTAGRLHVDKQLMNELSELKKKFKPDEILLTVDALTGQDIVQVAKSFNDLLQISGLIVTKFDGDSRGGGILSVRSITDVPVKFVGVGEKIDDIDVFYPERTASRILGMGDLESLVEKAQQAFDEESAQRTIESLQNGTYSLEDMLQQMKQMKKMGPMSSIMKMLPGMSEYSAMIDNSDTDQAFKAYEAIISSMTPYERRHPDELRGTHKNRIAKGSGTTVQEVNRLLNSFEKTKKMMNAMGVSKFKFFK